MSSLMKSFISGCLPYFLRFQSKSVVWIKFSDIFLRQVVCFVSYMFVQLYTLIGLVLNGIGIGEAIELFFIFGSAEFSVHVQCVLLVTKFGSLICFIISNFDSKMGGGDHFRVSWEQVINFVCFFCFCDGLVTGETFLQICGTSDVIDYLEESQNL